MAKIPEIPSTEDVPLGPLGWLKNWLDTARLWVHMRDPSSSQGDPRDKFIPRSELVSLGLMARKPDGTFIAGVTGSGAAVALDETPPPTPTGLVVTAGIGSLFIEWDAALYTVGHGHGQTNIYGAVWADGDAEPTFIDVRTKLIDNVVGGGVLAAYASEPGTRWCVWIKWQSVDGIESTSPAGGAHGQQATTGQNPAPLLEVLAGQITSTELAAALNTRINLVDGSSALAGSVNARILTETDARIAALDAEVDARVLAEGLLQEQIDLLDSSVGGDLTEFFTALTTETTERVEADLAAANAITLANTTIAGTALGLSIEQGARALADSILSANTAVVSTSAGNTAAALLVEQLTRATADGAVTTLTTALAAAAGDNAAAIKAEQTTRAGADNAQATSTDTLVAAGAGTAAALQIEQSARTSADSAAATQQQSLAASVANANAAITIEQAARSGADSAMASQVVALASKVDTADGANAAAIVVEQLTRAAADSASAEQTATLSAAAGENQSAIVVEQQARASADEAAATLSTTLGAAVGDALAGLVVEQGARVDAVQALTTQSLALVSTFAGSAAALTVEQVARTSGDAASAAQADVLGASIGTNTAAIQTEREARVTADFAAASLVASLVAVAGENSAGILNEQQIRASADSAMAEQTSTLAVATAGAAAAINFEQAARVTGDAAVAAQSSVLSTAVGESAAAIRTEQTARSAGDSASASQAILLAAAVGESRAAILQEQAVRVGEDVAAAAQLDILTASVGTNTVAIATEQSVRAGETGPLLASYTVKMDINGYMSGFGLQSSLTAGGTPTSVFLVSVDKFAVMTPPSSVVNWVGGTTYALNDIRGVAGNTDKVLVCKQGGAAHASTPPAISGAIGTMLTDNGVRWQIASRVPFSVLTSNTTINGISVPAGAYFDAAYLLSATVGNAQIGNLAVDNAKIADMAAAKLLSGSLAVGADISSTGFLAGAAGWRIQGNGTAEFAAATIRGQLVASQINGNGLSINAIDGTPILAAGLPLAEAYATQAQFQAQLAWNFNNSVEGWFAGAATLTPASSHAVLDATASDPVLYSPTFSLYGPGFTRIRARIRRTAGSGWDGIAYYSTVARPGYDGNYRKELVATVTSAWQVVEWDMAQLTSGGAEWVSNTITNIRLDLGTTAADTFEIDWIAIGSTSPGSYGAPVGSPVGATTADVVAAAAAAVNDASTGLAQRLRLNADNILGGVLQANTVGVPVGLRVGTVAWNAAGAVTGGTGIAITPAGIYARNPSATTFTLNAATGDATFAGTLSAASGSLGALFIATGGNIRSGQSAYNTGTGFYLGQEGGLPRFSIGVQGGTSMLWDGTNLFINTPTFDSFTASIPSGALSSSGAAGIFSYGSRSVSAAGGKAGYSYAWFLTGGNANCWLTNAATATVTVHGHGNGVTRTGAVFCLVRDANGRVTSASFDFSGVHAYDAGYEGGA